MIVSFEPTAFDDFNDWASIDKKRHQRIITLIKDIRRNPYQGLGKPEALKYQLQGYWSRRIDDEHRLVYKIENKQILIISCKYHYQK
jgi:toxin YoeB